MFTTGKQIPADLLATPSVLIIGGRTALCDLLLSAETGLRRPHELTRRAGPGVTLSIAWVRAGGAWLGARLATRVRREAADVGRVDVLTAPTVVAARLLGEAGVAAGASPGLGLIGLGFFGLGLLLFNLALVPFLDAVQMDHCPAQGTRPDFGSPDDLAGANDAFVLAVGDVLVNPSGQICRRRFGCQGVLRRLLLLGLSERRSVKSSRSTIPPD